MRFFSVSYCFSTSRAAPSGADGGKKSWALSSGPMLRHFERRFHDSTDARSSSGFNQCCTHSRLCLLITQPGQRQEVDLCEYDVAAPVEVELKRTRSALDNSVLT